MNDILIEHRPRLYVLAALIGAAGYGLGIREYALTVIACGLGIVLLPGLIWRSKREEIGAPAAAPLGLADDVVALEVFEDAALIAAADRTVVAANRAAQDLFGRVAGEDLRLVMRHPGALETLEQSLSSGEDAVRELDGLGRAGQHYRLRVAPMEEGRLLLNFVDISKQRAAERMRADFVANASHELRTPLATVSGFIETLQGPAADDDQARTRFLGLMADEAARMTRLIDDLLSLSRIELDKSVRPRNPTDLEQIVVEFSETMRPLGESKGHQLHVELAPNLPLVLADRDQLFQVLGNLVSNAFKYGREGTPVLLAARRIEGGVSVTVRDQGEGIAPEHIPRLTERFYRVDPGRSRRMGGTGLGLAIVKHIVERHRGRLEIRSELGHGTAVSFSLPAAPSA
ncbi:ATP-binding protein [Pacificimonas flava]|uniref:histidine kinase n=1 Tax=Pacificimonas flava TaxID=1234595 RepID=M2TR03_9SPHN|nr:ATP-binding protein [Pacificimonas flava]EMD84231.1 Phosphate regulon sensor protein PhoR (SphS) [Pacificimonas flava]MBB5279892.1 two-component system phosphate regulon sensor histidine kinase PhoR [Pacificimonas flava]